MSEMFNYIVNGGDELALTKAQLEHMGGALERELDENKRLSELILDACKVFERYDLPEHAFHYRRAVLGLEQAKEIARAALTGKTPPDPEDDYADRAEWKARL